MKTRLRAIARAGTFGSNENKQTVSTQDLQEIYESFADMDSSPITLGHDFTAKDPRLGNVVSLELKDDELFAITEEHEALASAVDQGFYPDVSIGAKRSAETGKMYLHHLAYLGEEPPAIKNLRGKIKDELKIAASDTDDIIFYPATKPLFLSDKNTGGTMNELEEAKKKIAELEAKIKELTEALEKAKTEGADEDTQKLIDENKALQEKLKALAEKYPDEVALSDGNPQLKSLTASLRQTKKQALMNAATGKIPAGVRPELEALADRIALSDSIELSDGKKTTSIDALTNVFAKMPEPSFATEVINLSDAEGGTPENYAAKMMGAM